MSNEHDGIARRNAESVMQTLHDIDAMVREQQLMLQGFGNAVSNLVERVTRLEEANNGRLIKEMGNGPTEQSK